MIYLSKAIKNAGYLKEGRGDSPLSLLTKCYLRQPGSSTAAEPTAPTAGSGSPMGLMQGWSRHSR